MNKVCIVGLGYIGLPTAGVLANSGYKVYGYDINEQIVNTINKGKIHIKEKQLKKLIKNCVKKGNLKAYNTPKKADIFIISVPTPLNENKPDISYVLDAVETIIPYLQENNIVLLESTSPIGTTGKIAQIINQKKKNIYVGYCPERVLPGNILYELIYNDRVIGGVDKISSEKIYNFYKTFVKGKIYKTISKVAELVKLAENSFRDVNIAFANELSLICDENEIDVNEVISLANKHPRVNILNPGIGVGGHCIAIDPWFIVANSQYAKLIKKAREVNIYKTQWIIEKIKRVAKEKKAQTITCLGIAYKPDIDDLRESPAVMIINELKKEYEIFVVEPNITNYDNLISLEEGLEKDLVVLLVGHREFKNLKAKNIIDFAGVFNDR
jgi:UDP-N-acetyl-D-mannosaminuronic acid dehydrogenase